MYNGFFGFHEKPFKLIPNPDFLYLGKSHEEALAHLSYATSQGDGFVEITGEVGTGKTTLCRVFLEDLGKEIEVAYIFNSNLDAVQLLKTIHTELGIEYNSQDPIILTETLNQYLLKKKADGKSVILLIDEAQHLGRDTLEQLRLLSNLETTKNKLMQIILVGQPELGELLDSFAMRQLRQRINLSCYILPLTLKETCEYIDHRVKVAARNRINLFSKSALKIIYKHSRGVPRRINIICDRALLVAYSQEKTSITPSIVKTAVKELQTPRQTIPGQKSHSKTVILSFIAVLMAAGLLFAAYFFVSPKKTDGVPAAKEIEQKAVDHKTVVSKPIPALPADEEKKPAPLILESIEPQVEQFSLPTIAPPEKTAIRVLKTIGSGTDRKTAFRHILQLWGKNPSAEFDQLSGQIESNWDFFRMAGMQNNVLVFHTSLGVKDLEKFNFPAILRLFSTHQAKARYVVLTKITDNNEYILFFDDKNTPGRIARDALYPKLTGDIFITCKNIFGYAGVIGESSPKFSVLSVKLLLREIGYPSIDLSPVYDDAVKNAIKKIQAKYGLIQDGLVGNRTKFALIQEKNSASTPFLKKNKTDNTIQEEVVLQ